MTSVSEHFVGKTIGVKLSEDSEYVILLEEGNITMMNGANAASINYDGSSINIGNLSIFPDSVTVPVLTVTGSVDIPFQSVDHDQLSNVTTSDHHLSYIPRSGIRSMLANLNLGGNRLVDLAPAVANTDSANYGQLLNDPRFGSPNTKIVSTTPGYMEFSSIAAAVAACTSPGPTNEYVVYVKNGIYSQATTTTLTNRHIRIIGESKEGTVWKMTTSNAAFHLTDSVTIKNMTICSDLYITVPGISTLISTIDLKYDLVNLSIQNFQTSILIEDTQRTDIYIDRVGCQNFETGVEINGLAKVRLSKTRIISGPQTICGLKTTGNPYVEMSGVYFEGNGAVGSKAIVHTGGEIESNADDIHGWEIGIHIPVGYSPKLYELSTYFECSLYDILIESTGTLGYSYSYHDHTKISNKSDLFYLYGKNPKIITVGGQGADFTSLKQAIAFEYSDPLTFSESRIFEVGPEIFYESEIPTYYGMIVKGRGESATIIATPDPTKHVFLGNSGVILESMTIAGAYAGASGVYNAGHPTTNRACIIRRCNFTANYNCVYTLSTPTNVANSALIESYVIDCTGVNTVIRAESSGVNPKKCYNIVANFLLRDVETDKETDFIRVIGPETSMTVSAVQAIVRPNRLSSRAVVQQNGSKIDILSMVTDGFYNSLVIENAGLPSVIQGAGIIMHSSNLDINIQHPLASGYISCSMDSEKVFLASPDVKIQAFDNTSDNPYGQVIIGDLRIGMISEGSVKYYNESGYIRSALPRGVNFGGIISLANSTTISISSGTGFALNPSDHTLRELTWTTPQTLTLTTDGVYYVGMNYLGNIITSSSEINLHDSIMFGKVIVNGSLILDLEDTRHSVHDFSLNMNKNLKSVLGARFVSGGHATVTTGNVSVTTGQIYYGHNSLGITASSQITFFKTWSSGGSWQYLSSNTFPNQYNSGGVPTSVPASNFTKNTLYVKPGQNISNSYYLVLSPTLYGSAGLAKAASMVTPPPFFGETIIPMTSFVISSSGIVEEIDERNFLNSRGTASSSGVTSHSDLTNLSSDDHPQYFLANGSRPMGGALNLANNVVINSGLINGINISSHASRHVPGGADPLPTAVAVAISDSSNSEGGSSFFARSDHVHSHGSRGGGTLHALATISEAGFLSASDKTLLQNAGSANGLALLNNLGNINFSQIPVGNVIGITANSLLLAGTANSVARSDHLHSIATGTAVELTPDLGNSAGTSSNLARADHIHNIPTAAPTTSLIIGGTDSEGVANSFSRSDHTHQIDFTSFYLGNVTSVTSTSTSDVLIPQNFYTFPSSGNYLVMFSGSFVMNSTSAIITLKIYNNGTEVIGSRLRDASRSTTLPFALSTQAIVAGVSGTSVEIRWASSVGTTTLTSQTRSFTVMKIS